MANLGRMCLFSHVPTLKVGYYLALEYSWSALEVVLRTIWFILEVRVLKLYPPSADLLFPYY